MAIDFFPDPVNPNTDPQLQAGDELAAELSGNGVSVRSIDFFPNTVDPDVDPEARDFDPSAGPDPSEIRYTPEQLNALAADSGVDAGIGGSWAACSRSCWSAARPARRIAAFMCVRKLTSSANSGWRLARSMAAVGVVVPDTWLSASQLRY
jgi:hypothetical protein